MTLRNKIAAFKKANIDFENCPEMLLSHGNISVEAQEISDRFFRLRKELSEIGLKLQPGTVGLAPLKAAVYRWAVWKQAASHTASLNVADPYIDNVEWPDSAAIMKHLGTALDAMFVALNDGK